jgi:hypothetical protein
MADGEYDRSASFAVLRPVPILDEGSIDEPETPDLATFVERAYLIAIGMASLVATGIADAIVRSVDPRSPEGNDRSLGLPVVARAALGAAAQALLRATASPRCASRGGSHRPRASACTVRSGGTSAG